MAERRTKQRAVIEQIIDKASRPLTRAEIWEQAKEIHGRIGFATVSRAVNDFLAEGRLIAVRYPGQPTRYETRAEKEHPHLLSSKDNQIYDLDVPMPEVKIPKVPGMRITGYEVLFFGEPCEESEGEE
ncbi:MAG: Fur family transcriptional regulator [Puniceicoccales bacterium]